MRKTIVAALSALVLLSGCAGNYPESPAPKAYVGLFKDDAVAVVDTAQNKVLTTIAVPKGPHGLVMTPNGRKVYVSSDGATTVSVIDTATDRVVATIDVGANPHGLAISADGRRVLVSGYGTNRAVVIDTATDRIVGEVPVAQPHNGTMNRDGTGAWVASQRQGETALVRLDLTNWKETARVPLDKTPRGLEMTPDGQRVYFTLAGVNAVQVLDTGTNKIVAQVPVGASPHYAAITPNSRWALTVVQGPSELDVIDNSNTTVAAAIPVGKNPHWSASSSDGRTAYVTNEGSNDLSIVDLATRTVKATIPVGNAPRKLAVQPVALTTSSSATYAAPAAPMAVAANSAKKEKAKKITIGDVRYEDHGTKDVSGEKELDLEADDYYFSPTFLRGKPGQKITVEVENEGSALHNFFIAELNIDKDIPPKSKIKVDVTFPASGVLVFNCKFHSALGMNGQVQAQ